jgi:hypothetical protein
MALFGVIKGIEKFTQQCIEVDAMAGAEATFRIECSQVMVPSPPWSRAISLDSDPV